MNGCCQCGSNEDNSENNRGSKGQSIYPRLLSGTDPSSSSTSSSTTTIKVRYDLRKPRRAFCSLLASLSQLNEKDGKGHVMAKYRLSMFQKNRNFQEHLYQDSRQFYQTNPYGNRRDFLFLVVGDITMTADKTVRDEIVSASMGEAEMESLFNVFENEDPIGAVIFHDRLDMWKTFAIELEPLPIHLQMAILLGRTEIVDFMLHNNSRKWAVIHQFSSPFYLSRLDYIMVSEWLERDFDTYEPFNYLHRLSPFLCLSIGLEWGPLLEDFSPNHARNMEQSMKILWNSGIIPESQSKLVQSIFLDVEDDTTSYVNESLMHPGRTYHFEQ